MAEEVSEHELFITEAATSAFVDTAWTKTVAGESWLINCCIILDNDQLNEIEIFHLSNMGMEEEFSLFKMMSV